MSSETSTLPNKRKKSRASTRRLQRLFASWLRQKAFENKLSTLLFILAVVSGVMTYFAFNELPPFDNSPNAVLWLLNIDLVIILLFLILIIRRIAVIWTSRRKGVAGAKLHIRLLYIFTMIAGVPAIIMTIFSAFFFFYSIHGWFSEKVERAITESQAVAEAYLNEHKETIKADILAMASDLDRQSSLLSGNNKAMQQMLETQSFFRNLSEAILVNSLRDVVSKSNLSGNLPLDLVTNKALMQAKSGDIIILNEEASGLDTDKTEDRLRALLKLQNYVDTYLYVSRFVDPKVLNHLESTRKGVREYQNLQGSSRQIQITITSIYLVMVLLLMMCAIWFALNLARRIVKPIGGLISTAERVRLGDLSARAPLGQTQDEFDTLAGAFNRMTEQLQIQQNELIDANRMLDYRRRFTETILGGVSTGVISVDSASNITLINNAAMELLQLEREDLLGRHIASVLPEAFILIEHINSSTEHDGKTAQDTLDFRRKDGMRRSLRMSISGELIGDDGAGAIVTFDDITDIQIAQRRSAWSDVARRIAHEIKNPLTPIQLAAERLRRKYLKTIEQEKDKDVFNQCTDTIIKHVDDIKNMVNAFSNFAKMPEPIFKSVNIGTIIRDIYTLQREANNKIEFELYDHEQLLSKTSNLIIECDEQQIRQVLTNLLQNAVDAVDALKSADKKKIALSIEKQNNKIMISIADSGEGIPAHIMDHITEPYVTNKPKGTGLGLAIVKKILEDHGGDLFINNAPQRDQLFTREIDQYEGAHIYFTLPLTKTEKPL